MESRFVPYCVSCGDEVEGAGPLCGKCDRTKAPQGKAAKSVTKLAIQPFVAVDMETTGVPSLGECQILELAMIYGDYGQTSTKMSKTLHFYIKHEKLTWQEGAQRVVGGLEEVINSGGNGVPVLSLAEAKVAVTKYLKECMEISGSWKNMLVGNNMFSLVMPLLVSSGLFDEELIDHNPLDFRSLFYFKSGKRVSVKEVSDHFGIPSDDTSAPGEAILILSCLFEEMAFQSGKTSHGWY